MSHDIWSIIVILGLFLWITTSIAGMFYAFPQRGQFVVKSAQRWGSASIVSFFVWILGLLNA